MVCIRCSSEERKPSIQEIASQKGIVQRANGWRVQHIAGQMDELVRGKLLRESPLDHWNVNLTLHFYTFQISAEQEVLKKMGELREKIPKVKPGQKTKFQDDLVMLNELLQVRISNTGNVRQFQTGSRLGFEHRKLSSTSVHLCLFIYNRFKILDLVRIFFSLFYRVIFRDHSWLLNSLETRENLWSK